MVRQRHTGRDGDGGGDDGLQAPAESAAEQMWATTVLLAALGPGAVN